MNSSDPGASTVVVVDPDPDVVERLRAALEADGTEYRIEPVPDPTTDGITEEADCVVSEYDLQGTDGLGLLAQVRAQTDGMPFILYTDAGGEDVASEAISAGVTDYVRKGEQGIDLLANRVAHAIAERRASRRAEQIERVNKRLREVDAALVRADSRSDIEQSVCDILADSEEYLFTWIGEYVPEHHRLVPRAHAGVEAGFLDQIPVGEDTTLPDSGPGPRALETGEVQVTQNVAEDEAFNEFESEVTERGFRSVATVPLGHEEELYGLLAIYADRPHAFDDEERKLLESLGKDIGHAIHAVALQDELREFREAFDHGGHAMCITDPAGEIQHVNTAFTEQTGYAPAEVVGTTLADVQQVGPEDVKGEIGSVTERTTWKRDLLATRKDGSEYHVEQTIAPIKTDRGDLQGFVAIRADVTERREREAEIRRERDLLEGLFDTSPTGIVVLSPEGDIVRANKRAEEILALEEDEITARTYDEPSWVFTDESGEELPPEEHPFRRVAETEDPIYDVELRMERDHADPIWVAVNGAPLSDPEGGLERLVFTFDDITTIKTAQRELEETNRTLDALIQTAPVGIIAQDPDGTVRLWNEGAEEIFGWTEDEAVGADRPPFLRDDRTVEEYESLFSRVLDGESFTGVEIERERKDGSQVSLHLSAAPIEDAEGAVSTVMAVFADLTDLKARERQLRQFREAVEHAGHSVMITDREGVIQYVNPAFEDQTGYTAEEALGRTPNILHSGAHDESFFAEMWETISEGEVWEHEVVNRKKDGTKIIVDQTIAPVFGEEGIEHFVAVNHDITERIEKEEALERQNQRLEEFASVVSHDLRNPLTVAQGHLGFLESENPHVTRLGESLDRMEGIIDEVLTLAREGASVEAVEPLDVSDLVRDAWAVVDPPTDQLEIEGPISITGDEGRTRRILENLCRNAVEHVGEDVTVRVGHLEDGGFYLEDDGPGIDEDARERVFESGYTTGETGTGLGLSIVQRLAEAQGWSVSLHEGTDGGARFEFRPDSSVFQ